MDVKTLLAIIVITGSITCYPSHQITEFTQNPGIYYENMHNVRFIKAHWKITTFIDLREIYHEGDFVTGQFEILNKSCPVVFINCEDRFLRASLLIAKNVQAETLYRQLLEDTIEFTHKKPKETNYPSSIIKRSVPFGFIGSLSKTLFGTLNEDDGLYYNDQIDALLRSEKELAHLVQQQAHLATSKFNYISNNLKELRSQQEKFFLTSQWLGNEMTRLQNHDHLVNYTLQVTEWFNTVNAVLDEHLETYRTMLNVIHDARHGKLHPALLNRTQLQEIQQHVHDVNAAYEFPIPKEHIRAERLSEVATVYLGRVEHRFLMEIHIPLLDRKGYDLYRMHPLPIPQNISENTLPSAYIIPRATYLAIGDDKISHTFLSTEHLRLCTKTIHHYICEYEGPMYEDSTCEKRMLLQPTTEALKTCDIRYTPNHSDFWRRINAVDGWLFSIGTGGDLQVYCPGEKAEITPLKGVGIVLFRPRCYGRYNSLTLNGIHTVQAPINFFYLPKISLKIEAIAPRLVKAHDNTDVLPLFKQNTASIGDWSTIDDADSLHDLENRVQEILTRKREQRKTESLLHFGLFAQIIMAIIFSTTIILIIRKYLQHADILRLITSVPDLNSPAYTERARKLPTEDLNVEEHIYDVDVEVD